jgi:uncharacterized protein YbjT (DUF2867 family)
MSYQGTVLVTGATGRTGKLVIESLKKHGIKARAFVRNREKAQDLGADVEIAEGDLMDPEALEEAVQGCRAIIITSSAGVQRKMNEAGGPPEFFYMPGNRPAQIDYAGQVLLVEAAKRHGVEHIVQVSTIAVTNPDHFLNKMGGGRTLEWKLRAENHLRHSGIKYTVVRPGGLEGAKPEQRALKLDTGDKITGQVARQDVAEVCVQALLHDEAVNKTFELIAEEGPPTTDFKALFATV